jgi:lysozyme family protein
MSNFEEAFTKVVGIEGRYSNNPNDSGGETMFGITIAVARAYGYMGPMRSMPLAVAHEIYRKRYWDKLRLDEVANISGARIADELFDTGVNRGTANAGKYLQRSLNAMNQRGAYYADVVADGDVGPMTIAALREYMKRRGAQGATVLLRCLNALQGADYIDLAEQRQKDEDFVFGWILNRVTIA